MVLFYSLFPEVIQIHGWPRERQGSQAAAPINQHFNSRVIGEIALREKAAGFVTVDKKSA